MADAGLVSTFPQRLSPSDIVQTFNASQALWARVLGVYISPNSSWVYLRVLSSYLPHPYYLRLHGSVPVKARKIVPWREDQPPLVDPKSAKGAVKVRQPRIPVRRTVVEDFSWEDHERKRKQPWIRPQAKSRKNHDEDIGFIPDPGMERERAKARSRRRTRSSRRQKTPRRKGPSLLPHYKVLGCKAGNRLSTIKRKFKKLAFKHHPDRNQDDPKAEKRFKEINSAFIALSNALSKK